MTDDSAPPVAAGGVADRDGDPVESSRRMPRWVIPAVGVFWLGYLATLVTRSLFSRLSDLLVLLVVSLFLSFAVEPGVNRLAARGWRRGTATAVILGGVLVACILFLTAMGTLIAGQIADLLSNLERYVIRSVTFINDLFGTKLNPADVIDEINKPDGAVQRFIRNQRDRAVQLSLTALGALLQTLSVLLFTFYLVADGPRLRRAICSRLPAVRQRAVLIGWNLAIEKTGGYLYSRALLAGLSAVYHWIVFQAVGTAAPAALAIWVGLISQFLPVVGTYLAGVLPIVITLIDSPVKALIVAIAIVLYQQVENYIFAPRITARTMEMHAAVAFGAALAGGAALGPIGALLALPAAAMLQAVVGAVGTRYEVVDNRLTTITDPRQSSERKHPSRRAQRAARRAAGDDDR
jgi:predicted PurR-regulated permease PerM